MITKTGALSRITKLEQQVQDLTDVLECRGIDIRKCCTCGKVLNTSHLLCYGPELIGTNAHGPNGVALKDGKYRQYYCERHLIEAHEDIDDWEEADSEKAHYTIAAWLLRWVYKLTPPRTIALAHVPHIQGYMRILQEEQEVSR